MIVVASPLVAARFDFSGYQGALVPFRFIIYQGQWNGQQPVTLGPTADLTSWTFFLTLKKDLSVPDAKADFVYDWKLTVPNGGLVAADISASISATLEPGSYRYDIKAIVINTDPQEVVWGWYTHQAAAGLRTTP